MQDIQYQLLHDELKFVTAVSESVVEPLLAWHKTAEKQKDTLIKREEKMTKDLKDQQNRVVSMRKDAHKQYQSCQSAYREYAKVDTAIKEALGGKCKYSAKDLVNAEKKLDKERLKTETIFRQLETMVEATNHVQTSYWNNDLPALIQDWERLEAERLTMLGSHMYVYSHLQHGQVQPLVNASNMFLEDVKSLQGNTEMLEFASSVVRQHGPPQGLPVLQPQLPCTANTIASMDAKALHELLAGDMALSIAAREDPASTVKTINFNVAHPIPMLREAEAKPVVDIDMGSLDLDLNLPGLTLDASRGDVISMPAHAEAPAETDAASPEQFHADADAGAGAGAASMVPPAHIPSHIIPPPAAAPAPVPLTSPVSSPVPGAPATSAHLSQSVVAPAGTMCIVLGKYDFDGTDDEDLVFKEEELIAVTSKPENSDWWIGCKFDPYTGDVLDRGAFPSNYVDDTEAQFTLVGQ
jgi:hypothetical protein